MDEDHSSKMDIDVGGHVDTVMEVDNNAQITDEVESKATQQPNIPDTKDNNCDAEKKENVLPTNEIAVNCENKKELDKDNCKTINDDKNIEGKSNEENTEELNIEKNENEEKIANKVDENNVNQIGEKDAKPKVEETVTPMQLESTKQSDSDFPKETTLTSPEKEKLTSKLETSSAIVESKNAKADHKQMETVNQSAIKESQKQQRVDEVLKMAISQQEG